MCVFVCVIVWVFSVRQSKDKKCSRQSGMQKQRRRGHVRNQRQHIVPLQVWKRTQRQDRIHSKGFIQACESNPSNNTTSITANLEENERSFDRNAARPFLSTCWRNLLPWDFSTETLVCVSSRDTGFTLQLSTYLCES